MMDFFLDGFTKNIWELTKAGFEDDDPSEYLNIENIHISPKETIFTNPFEGKEYCAEISIQNFGVKPVSIRILQPSSSALHILTNKTPVFLCSGLTIRRKISYKVQMVTLIRSCTIPIYINDKCVEYIVRIAILPVVLRVRPEVGVDFGRIDASDKPSKQVITIINDTEKPSRFFFDLGPNDLDLQIEPIRGVITGQTELDIVVTAIFETKGVYETAIWLISEQAFIINVRAVVGVNAISAQYIPGTGTFSFIQFPSTYYGTSVQRNVIMEYGGVSSSFFCVMGEVETETYPLSLLRSEIIDYRYFHVNPEEGRFLANDVRVFQFTYKPSHYKQTSDQQKHHLIMLRLKRTSCKDINPKDYNGNIFEEVVNRGPSLTLSELAHSLSGSALSDSAMYNSGLEVQSSSTSVSLLPHTEIRLMLYGQVEEVSVSILPDEICLSNLLVDTTVVRVLQLINNCIILPIIFRYKKLAFVEVKPKMGTIEAGGSVEIEILITPKSFTRTNTFLAFDLLHYNMPRSTNDLVVVGAVKIPIQIDEKIVSTKKVYPCRVNSKIMKPITPPRPLIPAKALIKDMRLKFPTYPPGEPTYYNIYTKTSDSFYHLEHPAKCFFKNAPIRSLLSTSNEFIPLTPIQVSQINITPMMAQVDNVAYDSTYIHTITITNKSERYLQIFLKGKRNEFNFYNGTRFTIKPEEEQEISFMLYIGHVPQHLFEIDVIINSSFVCETGVLMKACPKHLTLDVEMLTFYENEPNSKFVELHNQLNVELSFEWKAPAVFKIDPPKGAVRPGRFIACMITFEIGEAENMVYDLGIYTDNKYFNLKVLIEGTDYKLKMAKVLNFEDLSVNVPCEKILTLQNMSMQPIAFEIDDKELVGIKVKPREAVIIPIGVLHLIVCATLSEIGAFNMKLEIIVQKRKRIMCELIGTVFFPELRFKPEVLRFRKMAASSFDIACVTVENISNVPAMIQFDVDRFPEFSYSEYTNVDYMSSRDFFYVNPSEEKMFSIHFYPYNPLVTSFLLPLLINKVPVATKATKLGLMGKAAVKVHAQVLSYKLEVKSWRYNFTYFPFHNHRNVTTHHITIKNPSKSLVTICIRLDDLEPAFDFKYASGVRPIYYECSLVIDLPPEEDVTFDAIFRPVNRGKYSIRLPVYVRDDFTQDVHNYFNFVGDFPEAVYKYADDCINIGFVPIRFTIMKRVVIDMLYHQPNCRCYASITDISTHVGIDNMKVTSSLFRRTVTITYNCSKSHVINCKLELNCDCPGPNFSIDVFGGSENNYMTVHACIQYFKLITNSSVAALFDNVETDMNALSLVTLHDVEKEDAIKHTFKCDLPYFQSGATPFDDYMRQVVRVFEQWLMEQVFFGTRSYSIPEGICVPDIKYFEKQGRPEATIKVPLQLILNYLLGPSIMSSYEIRFSEKKPICVVLRRFYKDVINLLSSYGCYVNMIRPEVLLPYPMYTEYLIVMNRKSKILPQKSYCLLAKQYWLDLCMQLYKTFVAKRLLRNLQFSTSSAKALNTNFSYMSSRDMPSVGGQFSFYETLYSEEALLLLKWINGVLQECKPKLVNASPGNELTIRFQRKTITNFDEDLIDSLGIIACIITSCPFLEKHIAGIYVPANNRMEYIHNSYILLKVLSLLHISFHLEPIHIVQPNTVHMKMFITYLYAFLLPLRYKETIHFQVALSTSKTDTITIMNESKFRTMAYNVIFFNNTDDLFSVNRELIIVETDSKTKLELTYFAKFLRVQPTILFLSGEVVGYNYSNSKIYYLEGKPVLISPIMKEIELKGIIYKISHVEFAVPSPYSTKATYEIYMIDDTLEELSAIIKSMVSYSYLEKIKTLARCKFKSAFVESDPKGVITMRADLCNIVNISRTLCVLFRSPETGDFIARIKILSKKRKQFQDLHITMQKALKKFPCTCPKKKPDVNNSNCPRAVKVPIPCRNEDLWNAVMKFFLAGRDPKEKDFWDIYAQSQVGVHMVSRILHDHKRFLHDDMMYFMEKNVVYDIHTRTPTAVMTEKQKEMNYDTPATNLTTNIKVHLNDIVTSFYLELNSTDKKETRTYKVRVHYE